MKTNRPVLLVEDDTVDAMTVKRSFKELSITNKVEHAMNGIEALGYLENADVKPCLILLDINMPKMNGIEFLQSLKENDGLKTIPVVMLTTSNDEKDKLESYNLGVAGYMLKPVDYQQFVQVMRSVNMYWTLSELPE